MRTGRFGVAVVVVGLLALVGLSGTCIGPWSFVQVTEPRAGEALDRRVAVVYSKHYQINLGGLEPRMSRP